MGRVGTPVDSALKGDHCGKISALESHIDGREPCRCVAVLKLLSSRSSSGLILNSLSNCGWPLGGWLWESLRWRNFSISSNLLQDKTELKEHPYLLEKERCPPPLTGPFPWNTICLPLQALLRVALYLGVDEMQQERLQKSTGYFSSMPASGPELPVNVGGCIDNIFMHYCYPN
jgi:hypothetical protein